MARAAVTVVVPTFNAETTLGPALGSVRRQDYEGPVEILVTDGGSTDRTRAIAVEHDARVIDNPSRKQEVGCALGIEAASGELVLMLDADNELPHSGWLSRMVSALDLAPDVAGADAIRQTVQPSAPAVERLTALIGGTDPLAIDLGWSDRWGVHTGRWTRMPTEEEDREDAVLVRIDPRRAPPMGSNGFLFRRDLLLEVSYSPFFHPEVVAEIAGRGYRFARVHDGIIHHFAPDLRTALRKVRKRTSNTAGRYGTRAVTPPQDVLRLIAVAFWSLTLLGPTWQALRGYRRHPDRAWALYPLLHAAWTIGYLRAFARRRMGRL
ncbi:MAG TPA: glycosyltransferase family 2 protein [Solirubrobacterales bacterium]|jgi:glycosyltransferase involved in cell wall biosynthesis|nr:glycosyltransferase family 2 protein [Solirubrobacterales bacterium]